MHQADQQGTPDKNEWKANCNIKKSLKRRLNDALCNLLCLKQNMIKITALSVFNQKKSLE